MPIIDYTPPPTCREFMLSDAFGRLIAGPVGSGKTTASIIELFRRSCEQAPAGDGIRYTRFAIVRNTLKQLKDTVLKDTLMWFPGVAAYKVSDSTIFFEAGDIKSEWLLIPLETPEDQRRLLSLQITGALINEAIEFDLELVSPLAGRCGRYPPANMGGASWMGIIADTNMPSEGSGWHEFMTNPPIDWQIFIQPGGMTPEAENLEWLVQTPETLKLGLQGEELDIRREQGRQYYERFIRSNSETWCKRYVHAQYGDDPSGMAVFRESFKSTVHVVDHLEPIAGMMLLVGQDFGRDPWSLITQVDLTGRLMVLEEVAAEDIGLLQHLITGLRPRLLQGRYLGKNVAIVGDPSGRAKDSIYEETSFDVIKKVGYHAFPAPTNDIDPRIRAVESLLLQNVRGRSGLVVDGSRCPKLVQALNGGYRYAFNRSGMKKPTPEKNEFSHIMDALQYTALVTVGGMSGMIGFIKGRMDTAGRGIREERVAASGWT
jgi:hypothetical protein